MLMNITSSWWLEDIFAFGSKLILVNWNFKEILQTMTLKIDQRAIKQQMNINNQDQLLHKRIFILIDSIRLQSHQFLRLRHPLDQQIVENLLYLATQIQSNKFLIICPDRYFLRMLLSQVYPSRKAFLIT